MSTTGQIYNTTDHGKAWNNVSIAGLPPHTNFNTIEAGDDVNTAYVAARIGGGRAEIVPPDQDSDVPLIWRTTDGGKTWTSIVNGLPKDERTGSWVNSLRVDPKQPGLLFAGTETTVYVTFDNGDHWQSLRQNLPSTSIRDLDVHTDHHQNDLVIGTYGRGFWVLDDITPLRQIAANAQTINSSSVYLFEPEEAIRARINSNWDQPFSIEVPHAHNVPYGAIVDYYLSHEPTGPIQLQVFDAQGNLIRTMSSTLPPPVEGALFPHYWLASPESRALSTHTGLNRVNWNLYYDDPPALRHDLENEMNMVEGSATPGPHGPQVIPGTYTLKLTVDGHVYTRTVTVVNDPRVGQSPELMAALRTQNKLTLLSVQGMEQSDEGHGEVEAVKGQLCSPHARRPPGRCGRAGEDTQYQPDQNWRRAPRPRRVRRWTRPPCDPRPQRTEVLPGAERRVQRHGQHDAGRPGYAAHPDPNRHLGERLQQLQPHRRRMEGHAATDHRLQRGSGEEPTPRTHTRTHEARRRVMQLYSRRKQEGKQTDDSTLTASGCESIPPSRTSAHLSRRLAPPHSSIPIRESTAPPANSALMTPSSPPITQPYGVLRLNTNRGNERACHRIKNRAAKIGIDTHSLSKRPRRASGIGIWWPAASGARPNGSR